MTKCNREPEERDYDCTLSVSDQHVTVTATNRADAERQAYDWWCENVVPYIEVG